ncbi:MAG: hypothetical protein FWD61_14790 [Phycisphaerales bacterium]|nr:hypothetical protein [Phycisphaerales bacterium]
MRYVDTLENFFVLDKNALRSSNATKAKSVIDSANMGALVIDTTFIEQIRTGKFVDQCEKDLRDWDDKPDRMSISRGVGELMREELCSGKRAVTVVDNLMTRDIRILLSGSAQKKMIQLQAVEPNAIIKTARLRKPGGRLDAAFYIELFKNRLDYWYKCYLPAIRESIRSEVEDKAVPPVPLVKIGTLVYSDRVIDLLKNDLAATGFSRENAEALLTTPSFTGMHYYTMEAYAIMLWAQGVRLDRVNLEERLNELFDLDYVAYGLCCRGLQTYEPLMGRLEQGLRLAFEKRWP